MTIELSFLSEKKKEDIKLALLISLVHKSLMRTFIAMVYKQEHILIQYSINVKASHNLKPFAIKT